MNRLLFILSMTGAILLLGGLYTLLGLELLGADGRLSSTRGNVADRQVQTQIGALDKRVAKIESTLPVTLVPINQELTRLAGQLAAIERRSAEHAGEIAATHRALKRLEHALEEVAARPLAKSVDLAPIDALRRDLARLAAEAKLVPEKFAAAQRQIDGLRGDTDSLRKETDALRLDTDSLRKETRKLAMRPLAVPVDIDPLKTVAEKLRRDVAVLSEKYASTAADLGPIRRSLTDLRRDLDGLASRPSPGPIDLSPIKQAVRQLREDLDSLASRPTVPSSAPDAVDYEPRVKKLEDELFRLQKAVSDLRLDLSILRDAGQSR